MNPGIAGWRRLAALIRCAEEKPDRWPRGLPTTAIGHLLLRKSHLALTAVIQTAERAG